MRRQAILFLNSQMEEQASLQQYIDRSGHRSQRVQRMERLLKVAMRQELTDRQKVCVRLYYLEGRSVAAIAQQLQIRPTTVYKHLKKARQALTRCVPYLEASERFSSESA